MSKFPKKKYYKRKFKKKEPPKDLSPKEAFLKLASFCAYQERSHQEIYQKLKEWSIPSEAHDDIVILLEEENFLNEERFVASFVRGKFNYKKWGKQKIRFALKSKGIQNSLISKVISEEIEDAHYLNTLKGLLKKKWADLDKERDTFKRKQKTVNYALQKGYEVNLINEIMVVFK